MAAFIKLTQVRTTEVETTGEDDAATARVETQNKITLAVGSIRSVRPRNLGLVGSRITLVDGYHLVVAEDYDQVSDVLAQA